MICIYCSRECWNQQYTPQRGWTASHPKCRPQEVVVERRYTREGNHPMGYIPRSLSPFPHTRTCAEDYTPPPRESIQQGETAPDGRIQRSIRMQQGSLV